MSQVNSRKYENLPQFNTDCLAFLRIWHYFRLGFSFGCSGYHLTVIKKSQVLSYRSLLQKFSLKTEIYNLLLVNMVSQFTSKTINFRKVVYFLSLMSYSLNKPRSQILFTSKIFVFFDFIRNFFYSWKWCKLGDWYLPAPTL